MISGDTGGQFKCSRFKRLHDGHWGAS